MWKGRFQKDPTDQVRRFGESVSFDWRLYAHDIRGSIAHAGALARAGILSAAEGRLIKRGLGEIQREIEEGRFSWRADLEDVHMNIESALTERRDPPGQNCTPRGRATTRSRSTCGSGCATKSHRHSTRLVGAAARRSSTSATAIRRHHPRLHASPARAARLFRASSARLRRDARTRCDAPHGSRAARERHARSAAARSPARPLSSTANRAIARDTRISPASSIAQQSMDAVSDRDFAV